MKDRDIIEVVTSGRIEGGIELVGWETLLVIFRFEEPRGKETAIFRTKEWTASEQEVDYAHLYF